MTISFIYFSIISAMYNHAPKDYICPICITVKGEENKHTITRQTDVFYQDKFITVFIGARSWPNNKGGIIIVPNNHFENIYDIPEKELSHIYIFAKKVAFALKEIYHCDGTSMRQHNEPAGNQDAWHFHVHVMPRYKNDQLYQLNDQKYWSTNEERKPYADKLRTYFSL